MSEFLPKLDECARAILAAHRTCAERQPNLAVEVRRMEACHQNWRNHRLLMAERDEAADEYWQRCRSLLCAPCQDARISDEVQDILNAHNNAIAADLERETILISFKGPTFRIEDAYCCADDAINQWRRFSARKMFRHAVAGYVRGVELMIDHNSDHIHAQVSAVLLVDDETHVRRKGGWLALWNEAGGGAPSQKTVCLGIDPRTPQGGADLHAFAQRVATVAVRPTQLCEEQPSGIVCDAWKVKKLRAALRARKLIQFRHAMKR